MGRPVTKDSRALNCHVVPTAPAWGSGDIVLPANLLAAARWDGCGGGWGRSDCPASIAYGVSGHPCPPRDPVVLTSRNKVVSKHGLELKNGRPKRQNSIKSCQSADCNRAWERSTLLI